MRTILFFSLLLLIACTGKKTTEENAAPENKGPQVINLEEAISQPSEDVPLSEAVRELRIVPLETTAECLVGNVESIQIMGDDIFVLDLQSGILRFSKDGKFLNKIGTRGQGPGEYLYAKGLLTNEAAGEIGIQESSGVADMVKWYGLDGKFLREQPAEKQLLYYGSNGYVFNFKDNYFAVDPLAFLEERITTNEKRTAYWSLALLDANLEVKKEYMNPAFVGREKELWENRFTGAMANHWMEEGPFVDAYQDHFGLLYYRGDTIYEYQEATQEFAPAYILKIGSQPSFADAHQQYNREQSYFNALTIHVFAQTENKLYFQATKSDKAYTIAYNKADGKLKVHAYDTEIEERKFPQFPDYVLRYYPDNTLYIKNDLAGGEFSLDYKSSGKYWISILDSDKLEDFEATSPELLSILEKRKVDDNPILLIGVL